MTVHQLPTDYISLPSISSTAPRRVPDDGIGPFWAPSFGGEQASCREGLAENGSARLMNYGDSASIPQNPKPEPISHLLK